MNEHLKNILNRAHDYYEAPDKESTNAVLEHIKIECIKYGEESGWSDNDIDFAYLMGIFNTGGIDVLSDELNRLKGLNSKPSKFIKELKNAQQG